MAVDIHVQSVRGNLALFTDSHRRSDRVAPGWSGVLFGADAPHAGPQIGVAQEAVDERNRPADTGPVVVPQRGHQPGPIHREHQVRQAS